MSDQTGQQQPTVIIPHSKQQPDPVAAERAVRQLCAVAGLQFRESFAVADVALLLHRNGYDCTPGVVLEFVRKNYITEPPAGEWTAVYIWGLQHALEWRRRWLPYPNPMHDRKKSGVRLRNEAAEKAGAPQFRDLDTFTLEDLLMDMLLADRTATAEMWYEAVRAKLDALGFREE